MWPARGQTIGRSEVAEVRKYKVYIQKKGYAVEYWTIYANSEEEALRQAREDMPEGYVWRNMADLGEVKK